MTEELSQGWANCSVGDIAKIVGGGTPDASELDNFSTDSGIAWLTPADLSNYKDVYISRGKRFLTKRGYAESSAKLMPKGTVLFSSRAPIGYIAIAANDISTNQGFKSFVCDPEIWPEYLYFWLKFAKPLAEELASGTTFPEISGTNAAKIPLRLAPAAEQRRIAMQLGLLLGKVNDCQERTARIPVILKRFRQSVIAAACSGRLTADWRIQYRGARNSFEPDGESTDFPAGWRSVCIGEVIEDLKYGTSQKCGFEKRGVPVLRIPNVVKGVIDHSDLKYAELPAKERKKLHLLPGDILIVRSNGSVSLVGKCALVTEKERGFSYAGYLIRIRPNQSIVLPEFLNLTLNSYDIRLQIELEARSTSGVNNINSEEVRALSLARPPLEEQEEIVRRVKGLLTLADKIEARYGNVQRQVDRLPQSILAKAFQGELVPTEAELAEREGRPYESAEELLKRILNSKKDVVDSRNTAPSISQNAPTIDGISLDGFSEAVSIDKLRQTRCAGVPEKSGVYVIIRSWVSEPRFLSKSTGGRFKGLDPSYPIKVVHENWVDRAHVMYVGMTASGGGLKNRLCQFFDFGAGKSVAHQGGRLLWHLEGSGQLSVRWRTYAPDKAYAAETAAIAHFKSMHDGKRPFANLTK